MITACVISVRKGYPAEGAFSFARVLPTGKDAAIPLTLPILILVGILGGLFTATEAGAIAAFRSIILAVFLYRTIRLGTLIDTFRIAGKRSAILMFIVATSTLLGWYLTNQRIPQEIAQGILGIASGPPHAPDRPPMHLRDDVVPGHRAPVRQRRAPAQAHRRWTGQPLAWIKGRARPAATPGLTARSSWSPPPAAAPRASQPAR